MYYSEDRAVYQGLVYMKKRFPGKESHPPGRIKLKERFNEKNVESLELTTIFLSPYMELFRENDTNSSNIAKNPS